MQTLDLLLPYYGDFGLLQIAVRSVLDQDDPRWSLTVVDDGYPDPRVAQWFGTFTDPRVRYLRNETNLGANGNYRRCLELARAEYLVLMGADDAMLPNYVGMIHQVVGQNPGVAIVQPGVAVIDGQGNRYTPMVDRLKSRLAPAVSGRTLLSGETLAASLLRGNWTYFPSLCWRRSAVAGIGFRDGLNVVQDLALVLDVIASGGTMIVDSETAFLYRRHAASDSSSRAIDGTRFDEERRFFSDMAAENRSRGWTGASRAARLHLTSRLHAASLLPASLLAHRLSAAGTLLRHVSSP